MLIGTHLSGQSLAKWELNNNPEVSSSSGQVAAAPLLRGNGVSDYNFNFGAAAFRSWSIQEQSSSEDYIEVSLRPLPGYTLALDSIRYREGRGPGGIRQLDLVFSKNGFLEAIPLAYEALPNNMAVRARSYSLAGINVCDGETLDLRWYGYDADDLSGFWGIRGIEIFGSAASACTPPVGIITGLEATANAPGEATLNWEALGEAVMVVARESGTPGPDLPCSGALPMADATLGAGEDLGMGNYVLYTGNGGSVQVDNLSPGKQYVFSAYRYDPVSLCFNPSSEVSTALAVPCSTPADAFTLRTHPGNGRVTLRWESVCADTVLVLGSASPIALQASALQAESYLADAEYGAALEVDDFPADTYPVYFGEEKQEVVTNLANDQAYYFRIAAQKDGVWAVGPQVSLKPRQGCDESKGDYLFISELHTRNDGPEVDQGIELTGPAGWSLDNYLVVAYGADQLLTTVGDGGYFELSGTIPGPEGGYGALWVPLPNIAPAGAIGIYNTVTKQVIQLFAYRMFAPTLEGGVADGLTPVYITLTEPSDGPINQSLQRIGEEGCPIGGWFGPMPASPGVLNNEMGSSPLPIELLHFTASPQDKAVLLKWSTQTEVNNDYMAVERSSDGRLYQEIGRIGGAGTTQEPRSYQFTDLAPQPGLNHYRLRQVDFDGTVAYHGPVRVRIEGAERQLSIYPNPAVDEVWLKPPASPFPATAEVALLDAQGQLLRQWAYTGGAEGQSCPLSALPAGFYWVQYQAEGQAPLYQRLVKK